MNKIRNLIVGLTLVSLLAVGIVAVAGNGFGASTTFDPQQAAAGDCDLHERDADGDGILNSEDSDWARPLDGSGYGERKGNAGNGPLDGSGFGARQGGGFGQGRGGGSCDSGCL